jgi:hypothetical protein
MLGLLHLGHAAADHGEGRRHPVPVQTVIYLNSTVKK